jgi:beta-lactamase regulating signal transducer with metallopeptidase domain/predicted  nucleic acid-binding Zn-ribbon protein
MTAAAGLWILFPAALKAAVLLGVAALAALALRRGSGRLRHLVWTTALAGALVLPFTSGMALWRLELLPRPAAEPAVAAGPSTAFAAVEPTAVESVSTVPAPAAPASSDGPPRWETLILGLWALGSLLVLGRLLAGLLLVARLGRESRPPADASWRLLLREIVTRIGLRRPVRLLETAEVSTPMTGGLLRPAVFLPPEAAAWTAERRRVVLLHELVHVRRGDAWSQVVADLACALYWWNPLAWLARARQRVERETACDDAVIALGTRPSDYATHLLEIAASLAAGRRMAGGAAALPMIHRSQLEGRVMSILTAHPRRRGAALLVATPVLMTALVLLLAAAEIWGDPPRPARTWSSSNRDEGTWTYHDEHGRLVVGPDGYAFEQRLGDGLRFYVRAPADVEIAADGLVRSLEPGADVVLESSWQGVEPRLRISSGAGAPRYAWSVNGVERPFDEAARQWTKGMLAAFADLRETVALRGQAGELRGDVGRLRGERGRLQGEIGRIHGERGRLQGEIGRARGEQGRLRGEIGRIQGERGRLQGEIGRIRGERGRLQGEIGRLRGQIAVLRQLDRLGDELSAEERARNEARLEAKEAAIREVERQIEALDVEGRVREIEKQIEALDVEGHIAAIEKQIAGGDTEGRIAEIERQIAALGVEGRVGEIEEQIARLEVERHTAAIEEEIDGVERRLAPVESKLAGDYEEVKRLTSQVK